MCRKRLVLRPNSSWWGKKPNFKRIAVRVIGNTAALESNLLSGSIDMISGDLGITIDQALAFDTRHGREFNITYMPGLIYEHIDLNLDNPSEGRVEVDGVEIFAKLTEEKKPFIVFTAHTGNFELLPIGAAAYGLEVTALFRPPNNPYIARHVLSARRTHMGHLVPSRAGAAIALARKLDDGGGVGMLVDQKFQRGAKSTFFGHTVQTNPLLGKLARQFNCDVYPARCIRLPGGRFRLQIEPAIEVPRAEDGRVDVPATCQLLNDKVEAWVREYPGQWQWFHDRWAIKHKVK